MQVEFCTDFHGPQMVKPINPLTYLLFYWMDCIVVYM